MALSVTSPSHRRVAPEVTLRRPHRPVRADFPHTVLPVMAAQDPRRDGVGLFTGFRVSVYPARDPTPSHHQAASFPTPRLRRSPFACFTTVLWSCYDCPQFPALPSAFPALDRAALWLTSLVRSSRPGSPRPARLGVVNRFHPLPVFGPQGTCGSPKFPENPIVPLPCSRTPAEPWCLAFAAPRCCPPTRERGGPQRPRVISELYYTASALAVYASCRHHWRRRKTRFRGWPTFPGWDSSVPTEFCWEVSAFGLPLPWASLGAVPIHTVGSISTYGVYREGPRRGYGAVPVK